MREVELSVPIHMSVLFSFHQRCYYQHLGELPTSPFLLPLLSEGCCMNTSDSLRHLPSLPLLLGLICVSSHATPSAPPVRRGPSRLLLRGGSTQFSSHLGNCWRVHGTWLRIGLNIYYENYHFLFYAMQCIMETEEGAHVFQDKFQDSVS